MKNLKTLTLGLFLATALCVPAEAALFTIDQITDSFTVGDFQVKGAEIHSGTG